MATEHWGNRRSAWTVAVVLAGVVGGVAHAATMCTRRDVRSKRAERCAVARTRAMIRCIGRGVPFATCRAGRAPALCHALSSSCDVAGTVDDLVRVTYGDTPKLERCRTTLVKVAGSLLAKRFRRLRAGRLAMFHADIAAALELATRSPKCTDTLPLLPPCARTYPFADNVLCVLQRAAGCSRIGFTDLQTYAGTTMRAIVDAGYAVDDAALRCDEVTTGRSHLAVTATSGTGTPILFYQHHDDVVVPIVFARRQDGAIIVGNEAGALSVSADGTLGGVASLRTESSADIAGRRSWLCDDFWINPLCGLAHDWKDLFDCASLLWPDGVPVTTSGPTVVEWQSIIESCQSTIERLFSGKTSTCNLALASEGHDCTPISESLWPCAEAYTCHNGLCRGNGQKPFGTRCTDDVYPFCLGSTLVEGRCTGADVYCSGRAVDCLPDTCSAERNVAPRCTRTTTPDPSADDDGDGYTVGAGDCDDLDPGVHPGALEHPGNTVDEDCDPANDRDGNWCGFPGAENSECNECRCYCFVSPYESPPPHEPWGECRELQVGGDIGCFFGGSLECAWFY